MFADLLWIEFFSIVIFHSWNKKYFIFTKPSTHHETLKTSLQALMNILELPKEIILEIWSYVTESADIVR